MNSFKFAFNFVVILAQRWKNVEISGPKTCLEKISARIASKKVSSFDRTRYVMTWTEFDDRLSVFNHSTKRYLLRAYLVDFQPIVSRFIYKQHHLYEIPWSGEQPKLIQ